MEPSSADMPSSLAASMSTVAELLEGRIDTTAANGVHWGFHFALVAAVSLFPQLKTELEVLKSRHNADLTEGEAESLWIQVRVASDSLASHVPSLIACNPPDDAGE
jgi:hypothetical protein